MKKISLFMLSLFVAATMSATQVTFDFTVEANLTGWGITPPATSNGTDLSKLTFAQDGVTFSCVKKNSNDTKIWNNKGNYTLRTYKDNTITFTAGSADVIGGVVLFGEKLNMGQNEANQVVGNGTNAITLTATGTNYFNQIKVYVNEELPSTKIDTISVSQARERIDKGNKDVVFVKGVVATAPEDPGNYGNTIFWMTDIDTPTDSLKGYKIFGVDGAKFATLAAIPFSIGDTIIIKALDLKKYGGSIYETEGGNYVRTVGEASFIDARKIFPFALGALRTDEATATPFGYEIVLAKEENAYANALHMKIKSAKEKGIVGTYSLYPSKADSSFVDGVGPVNGTLAVTYNKSEEQSTPVTYRLNATFKCGEKTYRFDSIVDLQGFPVYNEEVEMEPFKLVDDVPYKPKEGDTITCAQAASYASSLTPDTESEIEVYVRGFAIGTPKTPVINNRTQQHVNMADVASAGDRVFMAYFSYPQGIDSIVKGDEIIVKGKIQYSSKGAVAEISNGQIYRVSGSQLRKRNISFEAIPDGAITVAEAIAIGTPMAADSVTEETYTVKGYIVNVEYQTSKDSASWYMSDNAEDERGDFGGFRCQIPDLIVRGDYVFITGKITKHVSTETKVEKIQIARGEAKFATAPTGIERVFEVTKHTGIQKVMMNGQMFIIKDGVLYNAQGRVVR